MKKYLGKIIKVTFLDHAMGCQDPVQCICVGQVTKVTKDALTLRFWEVEPGAGDHNNEYLVILISTIKKVQLLQEKK